MIRMKVVIFGLGSIGRRQARLLLDNFRHELFAFRSNEGIAPNDLGIKEIYNWEEVEKLNPEVAFITNPTFLHLETALKCAKLGMHLFIEKPLSDKLNNIDTLGSICRQKKLICYIAYCLRFHPVIEEIQKRIKNKKIYHVRVTCSSYLPAWREGGVREIYSASSERGGGVLLDLSHEFDYIQYLFGPAREIVGNFGRIGDVTIDAEDFADILIETHGSLHINLHLNFMSYLNERKIIIDFEDGCLIGDLIKGGVEIIGRDGTENIQLSTDRNEYLLKQTKYFFDNLDNPSIMNNIEEARETLKNILEFKNA